MKAPRKSLSGWYKLRWQVLLRDKFTCQYCGQGAPDVPLEVDHRLSVADGGTDAIDNLATACWSCNRGKSGLRQSLMLAASRPKRERDGSMPVPITDTISSKILTVLRQSDKPLRPAEIASKAGVQIGSTRVALARLRKAGRTKLSGSRPITFWQAT